LKNINLLPSERLICFFCIAFSLGFFLYCKPLRHILCTQLAYTALGAADYHHAAVGATDYHQLHCASDNDKARSSKCRLGTQLSHCGRSVAYICRRDEKHRLGWPIANPRFKHRPSSHIQTLSIGSVGDVQCNEGCKERRESSKPNTGNFKCLSPAIEQAPNQLAAPTAFRTAAIGV